MDVEEITRQTLAAWDEVQQKDEERQEQVAEVVEEEAEEQPTEEPVTEEEVAETEEEVSEADEPSEEEPEEDAEDGGDEEAGEESEQEDEQIVAYRSDNPQVQTYLDRFGGDVEKALLNEVHLQQALGRQGQEKAVLTRRVQELEHQVAQTQALRSAPLSSEQRQWVEEAVESQNPVMYVEQALHAGEFDLARAVCDAWAQDAPYEAGRVAQHVDAVQWTSMQPETGEQSPINQGELMGVLVEHFPEMPQYEQQMIGTLESLGEMHPLVIDARSNDPATAATAIVSIYEIARAQATSVKSAKTKLKRDHREAADDARAAAVVSSAQATPSATETPRRAKELMPGLTLDALDEALSSNSR